MVDLAGPAVLRSDGGRLSGGAQRLLWCVGRGRPGTVRLVTWVCPPAQRRFVSVDSRLEGLPGLGSRVIKQKK